MSAASATAATPRPGLFGSGLWVLLNAGHTNVLRLVSNLLLTRWLAPDMFGLMAVASTVGIITAMLSDVGLRQNIIRSPRGDDPVFLDTVWTLQVLRGVGMWLAACVVAMGLAGAQALGLVPADSAYAHPLLPAIIMAGTVGSVIGGFQSTRVPWAVRTMQLRSVVQIDIASSLFGTGCMLLCAYFTRSIWSLPVSGVATVSMSVFLSWRFLPGHRNGFAWDKASLADIVSFGKWLFVSSAVTVFAMQGDRLMLAGLGDAHFLGMYSVAMALAAVPDLMLHQLCDSVLLPRFSRVANERPGDIRRAYLRLRKSFDPLVLVLSGVLFAAGPMLVGLLYDERYGPAGDMLSLLALGLISSRFYSAQQVYLALGRPQYLAALNLARVVSLFVIVPAAFAAWGLHGALVAIALRELATIPLVFFFNHRHQLNHFLLELGLLVFWPLGYGIGWLCLQAAHRLFIA